MTTTTLPQHRRLNWPVIFFFTAVHAGALFAPWTFSWSALGVAVLLHWMTAGLGITLGFHRLVTHHSFKTPKWVEHILVIIGSLTAEGSPINWVGLHRLHHRYSDTPQDPHDANQGFLWSHVIWMIYESYPDEEIRKYTKDINGDPVYEFLQKYLLLPQFLLAVILYAIGGWSFVVWGVFVRVVAVYHTTWLVNSATHKFGYRTFDSKDLSTNCWWVALIAYGEGWHNNHHAHPRSARHGLAWWEIDATWMTIKVLESVGLARDIHVAQLPGR